MLMILFHAPPCHDTAGRRETATSRGGSRLSSFARSGSDWLRVFFPAEPLNENREERGPKAARSEAHPTLQLLVDDIFTQRLSPTV